ncbi:aspartate carbamoyltransferase regulatory subunit [Bacilliculturomica massiliensis]|uniref:aspartate carbamoyltransferase regulatory subunit n=1 Tax=Bacilliculturomica massiliensis TaxID=1917867 RepID=UPI001031E4AE|nr:aspartate carbamoyltransferase regulatory subunit [Bacilliculturomica massiliensis]
MVVINSIEKGIVIDHIKAGNGAKILNYLNIDTAKYSVAFLMNASSNQFGKKDVIKIDKVTDIDLAVLGLINPDCTVNIIEDHVIVKKIKPTLPETVSNVIKCKNPRCVTSVEANAPHIFHLINPETREYQCEYCDDIVSMKGDNLDAILRK